MKVRDYMARTFIVSYLFLNLLRKLYIVVKYNKRKKIFNLHSLPSYLSMTSRFFSCTNTHDFKQIFSLKINLTPYRLTCDPDTDCSLCSRYSGISKSTIGDLEKANKIEFYKSRIMRIKINYLIHLNELPCSIPVFKGY